MSKYGGVHAPSAIYRSLHSFVGYTADIDFLASAVTLNTLVTGDAIALDERTACPGFGRNITLALTDGDSSITALTLTVKGRDYLGKLISEDVTGVLNGAPQATDLCFKDEITVKIKLLTGTPAAADTINIGTGDRLGLPALVNEESQIVIERTVLDASGYPQVPTIIAGTSTYVDLPNRAFKAIGSGGSGALAASNVDQFEIFVKAEYDDPDNRFA